MMSDRIAVNVAPGVETALARALEHHTHILPGTVLDRAEVREGQVVLEVYGLQDLDALKSKILNVARDAGLRKYVR